MSNLNNDITATWDEKSGVGSYWTEMETNAIKVFNNIFKDNIHINYNKNKKLPILSNLNKIHISIRYLINWLLSSTKQLSEIDINNKLFPKLKDDGSIFDLKTNLVFMHNPNNNNHRIALLLFPNDYNECLNMKYDQFQKISTLIDRNTDNIKHLKSLFPKWTNSDSDNDEKSNNNLFNNDKQRNAILDAITNNIKSTDIHKITYNDDDELLMIGFIQFEDNENYND